MSRLSDSMISENYESRERLMAWDVPAIAGDREAVKAVLQEYFVRLMFQDNDKMSGTMAALLAECIEGAVKEFNAAPINQLVKPCAVRGKVDPHRGPEGCDRVTP
jgi:hypothetical protein